MKAEDKKIIYDLLKTASANVYGYTTTSFKNDVVFADDIVSDAESENQTVNISSAQNETVEKIEVPASQNVVSTETPVTTETHKITIEEIAAKVARCTRCQLARTRNNVVPGTGVKNPDVLVIGEGPGYDEDMQGLPFVGKAGMLLDKMLNAIQLDRKTNCFIANVVKCRPPQNRDPLPEEENACFSFLEAQIHVLKPKMILCMGRIAGHKLLDTQAPMKEMRNQILDYNGIPLMVTYHPSALLRDESLKRPAWEDLKKFRAELNRIKSESGE